MMGKTDSYRHDRSLENQCGSSDYNVHPESELDSASRSIFRCAHFCIVVCLAKALSKKSAAP